VPNHALEFVLLFIAGPAAFTYTRHRIPAIPALWALTACCLFVLLHDPDFDRTRLWNAAALSQNAVPILCLFASAAAVGIVLVLRFAPGVFLNFPRSNPRFWGLVMLLYPVLSVYPQGIVYRAFVFQRYSGLFANPRALVLASATAFAYMHIVFQNRLALILTLLGGVLFAYRYLQTGSLFVSSFEHALYGCAIFTIGLGRYFYHAAARQSALAGRVPDEISGLSSGPE
jgi:membrane protease YdiL (CAAX protease family)